MNMSGKRLWIKRAKVDWHYQSNILLSVFDWTIIIYLLIPSLIFGGIAYHSWWYTLPSWLHDVPLLFYFLGCYLLAWNGLIRTYMDEADQLYLLQHRLKIVELRYTSALFSISIIGLKWLFIFGLLLPITNHFHQMSFGHYLLLIFYFFSLNIVTVTYKQAVYHFGTYKKLVVDIFAFLLLAFVSFFVVSSQQGHLTIVISVLYIFLSIWQIKNYQGQLKTFYTDVEKEQKNKGKFIRFMFAVNPEIYLPKVKKAKKRSWLLWRKSKRIYSKRDPVHGVTELFIKAFLRDKSNVFSYLQLISITSTLIVLTPIWLKVLSFIGFWFFFKEWLILLFKEIMKQNPYLASDYGKKDYIFLSQKKCEKLFVLPAVLFVLFITILSTALTILI
ncbi:ABC transporter permease [Metabacillus litoralis]|uniref:ABC transporter permease n=1 Tax=Metabacillus litoralis TaxID=152268 RepID=UPI001CFD5F0F|nr:ABC transporter permease [Metabacillus litoralis]